MPIYEYRCPECGERYEKLVRYIGAPPPACPRCGNQQPERLVSAFAKSGLPSVSDYCPPSG